ncbi:MAG: hypothetical protein ACO29Z_06590 [Crocinitomicaceae bacterium]
MRVRHDLEEPEDTTAQAGWMYADLFLALMVVFLATISFVPQFNLDPKLSSDPTAQGKAVYSFSKVYEERLDVVFDSYDYEYLKSEIQKFIKAKNFDTGSEIVFVQIVAGYDSSQEDSSVAIKRAMNFSQKIDKSNRLLLQHASTTLSTSSTLNPAQIVMQITFAVRIGVSG